MIKGQIRTAGEAVLALDRADALVNRRLALMDTERIVEVPWVLERLGYNPGHVLDVGSADAVYLEALDERASLIMLCDPRPVEMAGIKWGDHYQGTIQNLAEDCKRYKLDGDFDFIICVSALDHVGLPAYGQEGAGDYAEVLAAAQAIHYMLRPAGRLLLTVPIGDPAVLPLGDSPAGQRVFSVGQIGEIFPHYGPASPWDLREVAYWRRINGEYKRAARWEVDGGRGHDGRAAITLGAFELMKRNGWKNGTQ